MKNLFQVLAMTSCMIMATGETAEQESSLQNLVAAVRPMTSKQKSYGEIVECIKSFLRPIDRISSIEFGATDYGRVTVTGEPVKNPQSRSAIVLALANSNIYKGSIPQWKVNPTCFFPDRIHVCYASWLNWPILRPSDRHVLVNESIEQIYFRGMMNGVYFQVFICNMPGLLRSLREEDKLCVKQDMSSQKDMWFYTPETFVELLQRPEFACIVLNFQHDYCTFFFMEGIPRPTTVEKYYGLVQIRSSQELNSVTSLKENIGNTPTLADLLRYIFLGTTQPTSSSSSSALPD